MIKNRRKITENGKDGSRKKAYVFIFIVLFIFNVAVLIVSAESSLKIEASIAFDMFIDEDFNGALGNYESLSLLINSINIESFKFFAHLNFYAFHNYYATIMPSTPYLFYVQQMYSRLSLESVTVDAGIKQDIDLENILIDPYSPYQRLLLNSSFGQSNMFQIHIRYFIGDFFIVSFKWYPSESFTDDIFIIDLTGNFGDFRFSLPFIYDRKFEYIRTGWDVQFFLLTQWQLVTVLHISGTNEINYEGFEIKAGIKESFGIFLFELMYYFNGVPFTASEITAVISDPSLYASTNRGRLVASQSHFAYLSLHISPDPFVSFGVKALASCDPFDLFCFIDSTLQINTNIQIVVTIFTNPLISGIGDMTYYNRMLYGTDNGGFVSIRIKYTF